MATHERKKARETALKAEVSRQTTPCPAPLTCAFCHLQWQSFSGVSCLLACSTFRGDATIWMPEATAS